MRVDIVRATDAERAVIQNLGRLYVYDLSEFAGWPCPNDGLYECCDLSSYWGPDGMAFVIRADGELAGFALVDQRHDRGTSEPHYWMGEFFVLRKFRRQGIGREAASTILDLLPGAWEIAQVPKNRPAIAFWRSIAGRHTSGAFTESERWFEHTGERLNVLAFRTVS